MWAPQILRPWSFPLVLPPLPPRPVPDAPLSPSSSSARILLTPMGFFTKLCNAVTGKVRAMSHVCLRSLYIYICIYALHVLLPLTCSVWSCVCFALLLVSNHVGRLFPVFPTTSPCRDGATEALTTADLTTTRDKQIKRKGAEGEGRQVHERVSRRRRRSARRERWLP